MATKKSQRIGIIIITAAMIFGTLGSFAVMVIGNQNQINDAEMAKKQQEDWQKQYAEYEKKLEAQGDELSKKYYDEFKQYESRVAKFERDGIEKVSSADLKEGGGEVIGEKTEYSAYYIGWNPKGKVFDQSIDTENNKLKAPLSGQGMIPGWVEGVKGMKIGGVREILIPSDKAYGEQGQGDDIPPNTPLKFVMMAIPKQKEIPMPDFQGNFGE